MADEDLLEGDNRPPVYYENGTLIIRASAIGSSCLFDLVAAGQGHEPSRLPANLQRAFKEGHDLEPKIIQMLAEDGWTIRDQQTEANWEILPGIVIRFHPDGIGSRDPITDWDHIIEIKALSDPLWKKFVSFGMASVIGEYAWQMSVMMCYSQLRGAWVGYNKGGTIGEDGTRATNLHTGEVFIEFVEVPPIPLDAIREKALRIKELIDGEDILTSGQACSDPDHWPCRYLHLRPEVEREQRGHHLDLSENVKDRLDGLVRDYQYHKGQEDEHKARREEARDAIISIAGRQKVTLETDKWLVPVCRGQGGKSYDWGKMSKELKDELKRFEIEGKEYYYLMGIKRRD
jgi:hypothetical protein